MSLGISSVNATYVSKNTCHFKIILLPSKPKLQAFENFGAKNKNFSNFLNISPRDLKFTV